MHVSFTIHYRNNLIDKKDSYLISCSPSWDDRNYSYGHQLYPSVYWNACTHPCVLVVSILSMFLPFICSDSVVCFYSSFYCLVACSRDGYILNIVHITLNINQWINLIIPQGPWCSWSCGSWIYNYLCNQCISPQTLWVQTPLMARCTRYNIMW